MEHIKEMYIEVDNSLHLIHQATISSMVRNNIYYCEINAYTFDKNFIEKFFKELDIFARNKFDGCVLGVDNIGFKLTGMMLLGYEYKVTTKEFKFDMSVDKMELSDVKSITRRLKLREL